MKMLKKHKYKKALNIGNWVSIGFNSSSLLLLVQYMLPANMKMEFFGEGMQDISMRVFYATIVGLVVGAVISSVRDITRIGNKTSDGYCSKSSTGAGTNVIAGLATGMISTFPTVLLFAAAIWTSYACRILWVACFSYDGDYRNAISDRCFGQYLIMQVELLK
jgi:K(+)-stimulated pyrophosphate-energized sodium pump